VSVAFQLGIAAKCRHRLYDIDRAEVMQEAAAQKFAQLVEVVPDESLLADFPALWPAEIEVDAGDQVFRRRISVAAGDPARPLDDAQLLQKARRVFTQLGEPATADGLVEYGLKGLDDRDSCKQFADTMWHAGAA
jgi:2-methylcitrate dehydratase PrpD